MDYRLKKRKAGHVGLNIGLLPGTYQGTESISDATYISEDVFWLLEPGIRKHCDRYTPYGHYGLTAVSRDQWALIIAEWECLANAADSAALPIQLPELRALPEHLKTEFLRDFSRNCAKLSKMILQIKAWGHKELAAHDQLSILGI